MEIRGEEIAGRRKMEPSKRYKKGRLSHFLSSHQKLFLSSLLSYSIKATSLNFSSNLLSTMVQISSIILAVAASSVALALPVEKRDGPVQVQYTDFAG